MTNDTCSNCKRDVGLVAEWWDICEDCHQLFCEECLLYVDDGPGERDYYCKACASALTRGLHTLDEWALIEVTEERKMTFNASPGDNERKRWEEAAEELARRRPQQQLPR